ncbi:MAG: hypothetical protein ACQPRJ_04505 [Solitalea-like symbiont of Acarus siro]
MISDRKSANHIQEIENQAYAYRQIIEKYFDTIRYNVDKLELIVDDKLWTLPKMSEILYIR